MPPKPQVSQLPEPIAQWLDREIISHGFTDHRAIHVALSHRGHTIDYQALRRRARHLQTLAAVAADRDRAIAASHRPLVLAVAALLTALDELIGEPTREDSQD